MRIGGRHKDGFLRFLGFRVPSIGRQAGGISFENKGEPAVASLGFVP